MKAKAIHKKTSGPEGQQEKKANPEGYPLYPESEDIYSRSKEEKDLDPEDVSKIKPANESDKSVKNNEKDFTDDVSGSDLDVPGSEEDEKEENSGSEDEENNFYSIGDDDNTEPEEDRAD
jgi:hypothetical protein